MAKACSICNKKISLLALKLSLKDGIVCKNCFSEIGLNGSINDIRWAKNISVNEFKTYIEKGEDIGKRNKEIRARRIHDRLIKREEEVAKRKQLKKMEDKKYKEAEEFVSSLPDNTKTVGGAPVNVNIEINQKEKHARKPFGALVCPHCKSANIQVLSNDANIKKIKRSSSINLNPMHPLTVFNHHEKEVKKHSTLKAAAAISTLGLSAVATGGTHSNKSHKYQCRNCGKTWTSK